MINGLLDLRSNHKKDSRDFLKEYTNANVTSSLAVSSEGWFLMVFELTNKWPRDF